MYNNNNTINYYYVIACIYTRLCVKQMLTKMDLDRFWDLAQNLPDFAGINYSYLSIMERNARSNLIKLLFADDESGLSSTICENPSDQN